MKVIILLFLLRADMASYFKLQEKEFGITTALICKGLLPQKYCSPPKLMHGFKYNNGCKTIYCTGVRSVRFVEKKNVKSQVCRPEASVPDEKDFCDYFWMLADKRAVIFRLKKSL